VDEDVDLSRIRTEAIPDVVYRVARRNAALTCSRIRPEDDNDPDAGHRFDVLGAGVLYVGSTQRVAFLETLGVHRPRKEISLEAADDDAAFMNQGCVPQDWRDIRSVFELSCRLDQAPPFVDLADVGTRTEVAKILRNDLRVLGIEYLDVPEVTSKNRAVTRMLARALYAAHDDDEVPTFGGIRYASRYDSNEVCWAVFDHVPIEVIRQSPIPIDHQPMVRVAEAFQLRVFCTLTTMRTRGGRRSGSRAPSETPLVNQPA